MICLKMARLSGTELSTHIIKTSINHGSDILFLPFLGTRILGDKQKMNILISILGPYLIQNQVSLYTFTKYIMIVIIQDLLSVQQKIQLLPHLNVPCGSHKVHVPLKI